jgi:hypothetical protein
MPFKSVYAKLRLLMKEFQPCYSWRRRERDWAFWTQSLENEAQCEGDDENKCEEEAHWRLKRTEIPASKRRPLKFPGY